MFSWMSKLLSRFFSFQNWSPKQSKGLTNDSESGSEMVKVASEWSSSIKKEILTVSSGETSESSMGYHVSGIRYQVSCTGMM